MSWHARQLWLLVILATAVIGPGSRPVLGQGPNPAAELRKLLENEDPNNLTPVDVLEKYAAKLKTLPEFLEASQIPKLIKAGEVKRQQLLAKIRAPLQKMIPEVVDGKDPVQQLALAVRLGDLDLIDSGFLFHRAQRDELP